MTIVHRDDSGTRDERRRRVGVVSPVVRWIITGVSLLSVLCFSGIIFGWAPLELMLLEEDQYNYETTAVQLQKLNIIFTVAQFLLSFASLPVGLLLDLVPKPLYFGVAGLCEITGLILFALSDSSTSSTTRSTSASEQESNQAQDHDHFLLGYSLLAVGGCMTLLGAYPASFLLPHYQAGILASISCLFDGSSILFFVFRQLQEQYGGSSGRSSITRKELFLVWSVVALGMYTVLIICWIYLERMDWKRIIEHEHDVEQEHTTLPAISPITTTLAPLPASPLLSFDNKEGAKFTNYGTGNKEEQEDDVEAEITTANLSVSSLAKAQQNNTYSNWIHERGVHNWCIWKQLQTWDYTLVVVFTSCQMIRCNFFIMTVDNYLQTIFASGATRSTGVAAAAATDLDTLDYESIHETTPDDVVNDDDNTIAITLANYFSWILPMGIIFVPLIEYTVSKYGVLTNLHITNAFGIIFGGLVILLSTNNTNAVVAGFERQLPEKEILVVVTFGIFTCFRAYLYAILNTYIAVTFGVATMGRMIGFVFTIAALVTLFQYPLSVWTQTSQFGNFTPANHILLYLAVIPIIATLLYQRHLAVSVASSLISSSNNNNNNRTVNYDTNKGTTPLVDTAKRSSFYGAAN